MSLAQSASRPHTPQALRARWASEALDQRKGPGRPVMLGSGPAYGWRASAFPEIGNPSFSVRSKF